LPCNHNVNIEYLSRCYLPPVT